jgi:4-carboxymuconolactone decarboxylase
MQIRLVVCLLAVISVANGQTPAKQPADPHSLVLVGDRFPPLKYDQMTPEQKTMVDHLLSGERAGVRGPFNVLLRSPEVGDLAAEFGGYMRFRTNLPKDVSETIIIMTGRFWMAQYEWIAHKAAALQAGVKPEIVDAIATGKRPSGMPAQMDAAYNFIDELLTTHQVTDATFKAAKDTFGEKGVVDMTGLSGWYCLVSMVLDVDRYPLGPGVQPELKPLDQPLPVVGMGFATPAPRSASAKIATGSGAAFNPFKPSPEAGELFSAMGERVRSSMAVPDELKELAPAITARYWTAQTEWLVHRQAAVKAGLRQDKARAIAEGRRPVGMSAGEQAVYNLLTELFKNRQVSDATFASAKNLFGERGVVDLLVSSAYGQIVSMLTNVDRLPLPANQQPELKYLAKPLP